MKKIIKLLPAMLALMLISPAFATPAQNAESTMSVTLDEFINITKEAQVETATATFNDQYSTLTVTPMHATFKVVNNLPDRPIYLVGEVDVDGGTEKALFGTAENAMKLVFTNSERKPDATSVTNIKGSSIDAKLNPNAFALELASLSKFAPQTDSGATDPTISFDTNGAKYVISNGIYNPKYTTGATVAKSFSTHDTNGLYVSKLTLTTTQP